MPVKFLMHWGPVWRKQVNSTHGCDSGNHVQCRAHILSNVEALNSLSIQSNTSIYTTTTLASHPRNKSQCCQTGEGNHKIATEHEGKMVFKKIENNTANGNH